jgi:hypothetical protein
LGELEGITKKQRDYIQILSSYPSTREKDEENIQAFLKSKAKTSLKDLTVEEASKLIQILLSYPAEYVFPCGLGSYLHKKDINSYNVFGAQEGCMHTCPDKKIGGDVNNCPFWIQK